MSEITDDFMKGMLARSRAYTVVVLNKGPNYCEDGDRSIVWEHARRNFELRAAGQLAIVVPVRDESDVVGIGLFVTDPEETRTLMEADPGVRAGWFRFDVHPGRSFPGDALPA